MEATANDPATQQEKSREETITFPSREILYDYNSHLSADYHIACGRPRAFSPQALVAR